MEVPGLFKQSQEIKKTHIKVALIIALIYFLKKKEICTPGDLTDSASLSFALPYRGIPKKPVEMLEADIGVHAPRHRF